MKILFAIAMLSALLALAAQEASAGYTQNLVVQVFDQDYRPVEGAQVYIEHQINAVSGTGKTKPKLTPSNGTVAASFTDWEELKSQTKYTYTLYVKYGSEVKSANMIAEDPPVDRTYSMQVSSYFVFVHVHDQLGKPLQAKVTIGNRTIQTESSGDAHFQLPPGKYNVKAEIGGVVRNADLNLDRDQALAIEFPRYKLEVSVIDDYKRPLSAQIDLDSESRNTSQDGKALFENVTSEQPKLTVRYNESFKKLQPNLKKDSAVVVVFDLTAPIVQELHHAIQKNGEVVVDAYVQEPGGAASGISGVSITYEVGGVTTSVPAYTVGYNSFEAKIPPVPKDTLVKYTVKATDREGNSGFATGTYIIPTEKKKVEVKKVDEGIFGIKIGWEFVVLAVLTLGVAGYGVFYYKKKKHEEELRGEVEVELPESKEGEPPPTLPPQA
jgi:hypothetical protein